jgi:hypothetical protein
VTDVARNHVQEIDTGCAMQNDVAHSEPLRPLWILNYGKDSATSDAAVVGTPQNLWSHRLLFVHRCSISWCQLYLSTPEQECSGQGFGDFCCVGRLLLLFLCKFHPAFILHGVGCLTGILTSWILVKRDRQIHQPQIR